MGVRFQWGAKKRVQMETYSKYKKTMTSAGGGDAELRSGRTNPSESNVNRHPSDIWAEHLLDLQMI